MSHEEIQVFIQLVSPHLGEAYIPKYASEGAAGMDLHAALPTPLTVNPGQRVRVPTGIAIQLPERDMVALVYARSGLAWKSGLSLSNGVGVVDSDYTGEIQVLLTNFGDSEVLIQPGDRIAQLVVASFHPVSWVQTETPLAKTRRGQAGFGSTGVRIGD
ncbi:dUTP diphosphatase [Alicyclobacillus dauci]|uniref:Deoxyuridine 5'-triphosphate nucleotidohydrolase n=1 Tax=Alicyclobacillus dauci TaxID=1475485 RepID=A0ABY6YXS7_9BACL|nr:dUTP diphosphatase [Alicyclobacillus dauci]WAH35357.1 dUTP diphosphatase [Alicyclobacillus dauci]